MVNLPPYNVDKTTFILFKSFNDFFFQFEACIIYCFHPNFVFDFASDVLIVAYAPKVYLSEVKVSICLFFL